MRQRESRLQLKGQCQLSSSQAKATVSSFNKSRRTSSLSPEDQRSSNKANPTDLSWEQLCPRRRHGTAAATLSAQKTKTALTTTLPILLLDTGTSAASSCPGLKLFSSPQSSPDDPVWTIYRKPAAQETPSQ